jgi:NAD(P)-dependent dehydrogenase (short-subunit alcohol dehydrogenase family)
MATKEMRMNSKLNPKSIFITGAASGMGLATARLFAERGWFIGGYDVDATGLKHLASELGSYQCITRVLDVTDRNDYRLALDEFAQATDGRLDLLFNNAGIGRAGFFDEQSFDDVMAVINVNLIGVLNGIQPLRFLKRRRIRFALRPRRLLQPSVWQESQFIPRLNTQLKASPKRYRLSTLGLGCG